MRRALIIPMLLLTTPVLAQHAGPRQQWQPQTERDPRLQRPVEMELVCISTQRGLPMLAEKVGVSLSVAPENRDTTGDRKFTLFAKGATLKEIMVQLCEALRECHWDVDASGPQPRYLLHRNAGVEAAERERQEAVWAEAQARRRRERTERVEEARRALAMGPEELAELEKTDLFLARALRDPATRGAMEAFLSLPPEQIQEFAERGGVNVPYSQFPPKAQQLLLASVRAEIAWAREYYEGEGAGPGVEEAKDRLEAFARALPQSLEEATIGARYSISLGLYFYLDPVSVFALPPRYPPPYDEIARRLLERTGDTTEAAAARLKQQWTDRHRRRTEEEQQRLRERVLAPEVERLLGMPFKGTLSLIALQQAAAEQTGLSLVADAFWADRFQVPTDTTDPRHPPIPDPALVRQALDAASSWVACEWWTTGRVLVMRHKDFDWYEHAQCDVPESVVLRYREKLRAQGRFTLDDAVALAVEVNAAQRSVSRGAMSLPEDLAATGVGDLALAEMGWAPALLQPLTPEQRARAERAEGLRLSDLTQKQRDRAQELAGGEFGGAMDQPEAVFHIARSEGVEEGRRYVLYELRLSWGEGEDEQLTTGARVFEGGGG